MSELKEIMVAAAETVTISIEEYRALLERSVYLNLIIDVYKSSRSYVLEEIIKSIDVRLSRFIAIKIHDEGGTTDPEQGDNGDA